MFVGLVGIKKTHSGYWVTCIDNIGQNFEGGGAPYTSFVNVYLQLSNVHSLMIPPACFIKLPYIAAIGPTKDM